MRLTQEKAHIARQFMSLRANEKMTSDFCYYLTGFLSDRIKRNATGLIEGIDRGTVLNQTVFLPPLHEQKKIARFFSKLDFTITAHENMLDTLINERTGLMAAALYIKSRCNKAIFTCSICDRRFPSLQIRLSEISSQGWRFYFVALRRKQKAILFILLSVNSWLARSSRFKENPTPICLS